MVEGGESKHSVYADPSRSCDIVMKGGITSGVVYPRAVTELARTFRFRNVGGTSAGAIAAAATAAAEYGRDTDGFERLDELPDWLGEPGNLPGLFQPQAATEGLFAILLAKVTKGTGRAIAVAFSRNWRVVGLGALPGIALLLFAASGSGALMWAAYAAGLLLLASGAILALLAHLAAKLVRAVPDNGYGLCSGWTEAFEADEESGPAPLTPWLHRTLNRYAGLRGNTPLTFGHLWLGPDNERRGAYPAPEDREVELAMMTTNLTNRRAHRLPMESEGWFFCPDQFRKLFPEEVVEWMERCGTGSAEGAGGEELRGLPKPEDMPVIVATRMSLSFPVLLSAVPLWRVDESRKRDVPEPGGPKSAKAPKPEVCWFSDGGISSNFPIHFFDGLVPRRPTFGINLRPFRLGETPDEEQAKNTEMVEREDEAVEDWWYRLPPRSRRPHKDRRLYEFLTGIGETMQTRADEGQMRVPGYRDRIAHVSLSKAEGGMNLAMDEKTITALIERGKSAGELLRDAYTREPKGDRITWDSHRWTRLRSALAVLEEMHSRFVLGYDSTAELLHGPVYEDLLERGSTVPPPDFRWLDDVQKELGRDQVKAIRTAEKAKTDRRATVEAGAPKPLPEGRIAPRE
ncbi:MAG TPA: patatin-like phospholipase family protein [Solirubrobacterales bacterium]